MKFLTVFVLACFIYICQGRPQNETTYEEEEVSTHDEEYTIFLCDWISELIEHVSMMIHSFMAPLVSEIEYTHHIIDEQENYIQALEEHYVHKDEMEAEVPKTEASEAEVPVEHSSDDNTLKNDIEELPASKDVVGLAN